MTKPVHVPNGTVVIYDYNNNMHEGTVYKEENDNVLSILSVLGEMHIIPKIHVSIKPTLANILFLLDTYSEMIEPPSEYPQRVQDHVRETKLELASIYENLASPDKRRIAKLINIVKLSDDESKKAKRSLAAAEPHSS